MTSSRKRRGKVGEKVGETLGRQNTGTVATGVIKSAKRSNVQHHKTTGMVFHPSFVLQLLFSKQFFL